MVFIAEELKEEIEVFESSAIDFHSKKEVKKDE